MFVGRTPSLAPRKALNRFIIISTVLPNLIVIDCELCADTVEYRYDCDVLPYDPAAGWQLFQPCDEVNGCLHRVEGGHLFIDWTEGGDIVNFTRILSGIAGDSWIEWQFRANRAFIATDPGCDAAFTINGPYDWIWMYGNFVENAKGTFNLGGLTIDEFQTHRFERKDGTSYTFSVNGRIFIDKPDDSPFVINYIQMHGLGACNRPPLTLQRNMWDHVWYGTPFDGQVVVASDPPSGIVNAAHYPSLDTFTITVNEAGFVHVHEIVVSVSPPETVTPEVQWTRRQVNGEPDTIEIVLTSPLPLNATTTFAFDFGGEPQIVEYTYIVLGACCLSDGQCLDNSDTDCTAMNGKFSPGGQCEGDTDSDGVDGVCGDQCPMDENKLAPGVCGCGIPDTDSDGDTVADCLDRCPGQNDLLDSDSDTVPDCLDQCQGEDDRIDADENGTPDCAQFQPIPTASTWGLGILALLLLIAAKLRRIGDWRLSIVDWQKMRFLAVLLSLGCGLAGTDAAIKYVKPTSSGSADCSSWSNACTLPTAISAASSGDEIWVKSGTYAPFVLKNAVKIIGGFAGTESAASQSDPTTNTTIVDGNEEDQCVTGDGEGTTTVLRGFTIKDCAISGSDPIGAGLYLKDSSARIVQCIFEDNSAQFFGAAVGIQGTGAPEFVNCTFRGNGSGSGSSASPYGGGAVWVHSGNAKFTNCLFHDNIAGEAGALGALLGTVTLVNCTFAQNTAGFGSGGAIFDPGRQITIQNSILWDNEAALDGDQIYGSGVTTAVTYSNVEGGWTGTGNINSDPLFVNAASDDFKIPMNSPSKDVGSNALLPADVADLDFDTNITETLPKDLAGANRKIQFTVDMGCFEGPVNVE